MDTILIIVTALALAMAVGMAVIVAKMLRHERARFDARVEALSMLAAEPVTGYREPAHRTASTRVLAERTIVDEPAPRSIDDLEIRPQVPGVSHLFEEPVRSSPWIHRLIAVGCVAGVLLAIGVALTTVRSRATTPSATSATTTAAAATPAAATPAAATASVAPLELLSLRHTQETDRIVIAGTVQNPRTAPAISHVEVTVFVFGPDGRFLSSSRAPLDFMTLTPGGESPFVVNVPVTGQVARYRVGFRTEDGHVLPHVDKRAPDALAQK